MRVTLTLGEIVEREVKTGRKTLKIPAFEPLFESPTLEIFHPDDLETLKDWVWKVNGLIRGLNLQISLELEGES